VSDFFPLLEKLTAWGL